MGFAGRDDAGYRKPDARLSSHEIVDLAKFADATCPKGTLRHF